MYGLLSMGLDLVANCLWKPQHAGKKLQAFPAAPNGLEGASPVEGTGRGVTSDKQEAQSL